VADACVFAMGLDRATYEANTHPMRSHINVGLGKDLSIRELAESVRDVVGFQGNIRFDAQKSDGAPRKLLDMSCLNPMGWRTRIDLRSGLQQIYGWFLRNLDLVRA